VKYSSVFNIRQGDYRNFEVGRYFYESHDYARLVKGHFVEDLYALAACDYIIGPPSTYTM
jgi:hypothetical protein